MREIAAGVANVLGEGVIIADSAGFVAQRVVAAIVNIAAEIVQKGLAVPADVDDAARLGLGYPVGPLAIGDLIGPETVLHMLATMHELTGEPRFRPSPWLRRRAMLGISLAEG